MDAMQKLSYGLFVLTAKDGEKDNGCIINTVTQITSKPKIISIAVNKGNHTHDMIKKTGIFNVSVLSTDVPFHVFEHFGFQSGRDINKFEHSSQCKRSKNGVFYVPKYANAFISGEVIDSMDFETHTLFIAKVTEDDVLSDVPSVTYAYYFENIKPKKPVESSTDSHEGKKKVWVCRICGFVYEGDVLPDDYECPICNHPASDFEEMWVDA